MRNIQAAALLLPIVLLNVAAGSKRVSAQTSDMTVPRQLVLPTTPIEKPNIKSPIVSGVVATMPVTSNKAAERIDTSTLTLKQEKVTLSNDDKISDLLEAGGIRPDVNSLSLIYDLNPTIADIRGIPSGTTLILPRIEGDIHMEMAARTGYRLALSSSAADLAAVNNKAEDLKKLSDLLASVDASRFRNKDDKPAVTKALEVAQSALKVIGSNRFPVSRKVLQQSSLEAENLKQIVLRSVSSQAQWGVDARASIEKTSASLKAKSDDLVAGGSAQVTVEVVTKRRADGSPVPLLRVFYAPEFNLKAVKKFADPSTPTSEALPMSATFVFWAGDGDDSSNRLSDTETATVDDNHNHVTLLIKKSEHSP